MEISEMKTYVYSSNKFMLFTINEIMAKHFDCEVECRPLPTENPQEIFTDTSSHVVIFDSSLLFVNDIRTILNSRGHVKAIALVNGEVDYSLRQIISSYVDGMIGSNYDVDIIVLIINAVMKGFQCVPQTRLKDNGLNSQLSRLTQREKEVLHFLSQGLSNKAIADFLGVSYKTVCVHRYNIMYKLKLSKLSDLSIFKGMLAS